MELLRATTLLLALEKAAPKVRYTWTPELADKQASDENSGAPLQPHSWDDKLVHELPTKSITPTEEVVCPSNIPKLAEHIKKGKPLPPIYVDADHKVLDGHHRLAAALSLRLKTISAIKRSY
jgi:hypothetical protein